jgi:hypothetical protein
LNVNVSFKDVHFVPNKEYSESHLAVWTQGLTFARQVLYHQSHFLKVMLPILRLQVRSPVFP